MRRQNDELCFVKFSLSSRQWWQLSQERWHESNPGLFVYATESCDKNPREAQGDRLTLTHSFKGVHPPWQTKAWQNSSAPVARKWRKGVIRTHSLTHPHIGHQARAPSHHKAIKSIAGWRPGISFVSGNRPPHTHTQIHTLFPCWMVTCFLENLEMLFVDQGNGYSCPKHHNKFSPRERRREKRRESVRNIKLLITLYSLSFKERKMQLLVCMYTRGKSIWSF